MLCVPGFVASLVFRLDRFMYGTLIMVGIPFLISAMFVFNHYFLSKKQAGNDLPAL